MAQFDTQTFTGYYEISYFKTNYFNPTVSLANFNTFSNVNLYAVFNTSSNSNFENLFETYDTDTFVGSEPPADSLFNMDNMISLVNLGMAAPNIITNTSENYNVTFTLDPEWIVLTQRLKL
jgi:hypothetical protein